jgi:hypothetical protein
MKPRDFKVILFGTQEMRGCGKEAEFNLLSV